MPDKQFIEVNYGPVKLAGPPKQRPSKLAIIWSWFGKTLTALRGLLVNLSVIAALIAVAALTFTELRRQPVIIEEISLPPQLVARGFSGSVAAHRLWDAIKEIQGASGTSKEQVSLTTAGRQLDVVEPGTGLSLQGMAQMLRALLGLPQGRIGGEVTCETSKCDWSELRLRLRIFTDDQVEVRDIGLVGGRGTENYFKRGAVEALKIFDPYTLAAYYDDENRAASKRIALYLVSTSHPQRAWAANLLGNNKREDGDNEAAIVWYNRSIYFAEADQLKSFALPWNNWGNSLGDLGRKEEAIEKYKRATELDPSSAILWNNWGNSLGAVGREKEAFEKYREALVLDPNLAMAARNWGRNLSAYLRADDAQRCARAMEHGPLFLEASKLLLEDDWIFDQIIDVFKNCDLPIP